MFASLWVSATIVTFRYNTPISLPGLLFLTRKKNIAKIITIVEVYASLQIDLITPRTMQFKYAGNHLQGATTSNDVSHYRKLITIF
jgi:hypothetical protein